MDFFDFSCPYCQQELSISTELKGKFFKCPNCGKEILMEFQKKVQFPTENKEKRKQNAESEKPDFIYEGIKQLKTEATRQNEFSNMLLKELRRTNRALSLFILFSVLFGKLLECGESALDPRFINAIRDPHVALDTEIVAGNY